MKRLVLILLLLLPSPLLHASDAPAQSPAELKNLGLAQLENEQAQDAEATFQALAKVKPKDPLPWANLAVARLRQQKGEAALEAVRQALERAPGHPEVLAIQGEILHWEGRDREALDILREASTRASGNLEILYALYRLSTTLEDAPDTPQARLFARQTLNRLTDLRPENVVLLSARGRRAIEDGNREAATGAYLRLRELTWQGPEAVQAALAQVLDALEGDDLSQARVPSLRLENVLKVTPMYQQSLRALTLGIQGVPLWRFADEPAPSERTDWGQPAEVRFSAASLSEAPSPAPGALAVGDFDGDGTTDLARLARAEEPFVELHLSTQPENTVFTVPPGRTDLTAADVDNDGHQDLIAFGPTGATAWRGGEGGTFEPATETFGLDADALRGAALTGLDFDIEGDLDFAVAADAPGLLRNPGTGVLTPVGREAFPAGLKLRQPRGVLASDLDLDGDVDLLFNHGGGFLLLDNLRQGAFEDRTARAGLDDWISSPRDVVSADFDHDGHFDLVALDGSGTLHFAHNAGGRFAPWRLPLPNLPKDLAALAVADFDHDGRLDVGLAGAGGVIVLARRGEGFERLPLEGGPGKVQSLAAADLDGDGDVDLAAAGAEGLFRLTNQGGNGRPWLTVRLRGLAQGNSKNNVFGVGSTVEIWAGDAYQIREAQGDAVHFGLGGVRSPDNLRITWTNGVPQHRIAPETNQTIVEEQVLKGSCPFLYAWDGSGYTFVTDLLWGAPAGLPLAPGVWAPADPEELVKVPNAVAEDGLYRLSITEELWEAAFFDVVRLWVVDHPRDVEVASSLEIVPGRTEPEPERVHGTRELRPVARAWDGRGDDVTERVARRDEVYADGYEPSAYQGFAAEPWTFTFDLGEAPGGPVRLHLDGWIFPADASLNLAAAQRPDLPFVAPRLEVETPEGWRVLLDRFGHAAGKTKTRVVDTPPLPAGAHKLRIVSNLWLHWDRIAWSVDPADDAPRVVARLEPRAELRFRGFSELLRRAPNAPHAFAYERVSTESPWRPFPGRYTRFGDVTELLLDADSRSVILAPGDEMRVTFDASHLPPPAAGFVRTVFLESHGWDKDADRNTYAGQQVEPLPFRGMSGYPYGPDEAFPDTPLHRAYRQEWLTRVVAPESPRDLESVTKR